MIVTCERCATQFQLDDARIPDSGVRVRCSRCKHAFEVLKGGAQASPSASGLDDEESDWQFNEDPPGGPGDTGSGAEGVVDDLLGGSGSGRKDISLEADGEGAGSASAKASRDAPSGPSIDIDDSDDLFSNPSPAGALGVAGSGPGRDSGSLDEEEPPDLALEFDLGPAGASPPEKQLSATEKAELVEDPAAAMAEELSTELDRDVARELSGGARGLSVPAGPDEASSGDLDALAGGKAKRGRVRWIDPEALLGDRARLLAVIRGAGQAAGWTVVAALFALGLRGGLFPDAALAGGASHSAPSTQPASIGASGGIQLEEVSGRFVDHLEAGPVYVVSGRLRNAGSKAVEAGTVALTVVDPQGLALSAPAQAAAPLSTHAVREGRLDGPWRRSPRLAPGESRPFEAVVGALPQGAQALRLVRVASGEAPASAEASAAATGSAASETAGEAPGSEDPANETAGVVAEESPEASAPPAAAAP